MRIGILTKGLVSWGGGTDFVRSFVRALRMSERYDVTILIEIPPIKERLKSIIKRLCGKGSRIFSPQDAAANFTEFSVPIVFYYSYSLESITKKYKIDVLLPAMFPLGEKFPVPWVGFLYDVQHKHLPQYQRKRDVIQRDKAFHDMLQQAKSVVLCSTAVVRDVERFFPGYDTFLMGMPFGPGLSYTSDLPLTKQVETKYGLPERFFVICNQFWKHKNHRTAFNALARFYAVSSRDQDIALVCTGKPQDTRFPGYIAELRELIRSLGIERHVYILGLVPKSDQMALLNRSIALIQPTLFEGTPGGLAACDAVLLRKPVMLSDIEVNREIRVGRLSYFEPESPDALCQKMRCSLKDEYDYDWGYPTLSEQADVYRRAIEDAIGHAMS